MEVLIQIEELFAHKFRHGKILVGKAQIASISDIAQLNQSGEKSSCRHHLQNRKQHRQLIHSSLILDRTHTEHS